MLFYCIGFSSTVPTWSHHLRSSHGIHNPRGTDGRFCYVYCSFSAADADSRGRPFVLGWIGEVGGFPHRGGEPIGSIGFSVSCWVKTYPQLLSLQVEVNVFHYCAAMSVCTCLGCHGIWQKSTWRVGWSWKKWFKTWPVYCTLTTHLKIQNHTNTCGIDAKYHLLFQILRKTRLMYFRARSIFPSFWFCLPS